MGVSKQCFEQHCKSYFDKANKIVELGAQDYYLEDRSIPGYFKNLFPQYPITSVDLNRENGSIPLDLSNPIIHDVKYDLLSNFGTSEHVKNQYWCWRNIHTLVEKDGIVISEIPEIGSWKNHCNYFVDYSFFKSLSKDFEILDYRSIYYPGQGYNVLCIMKKISEEFLTSEEELMKYMFIDHSVVDRISY